MHQPPGKLPVRVTDHAVWDGGIGCRCIPCRGSAGGTIFAEGGLPPVAPYRGATGSGIWGGGKVRSRRRDSNSCRIRPHLVRRSLMR